MTDEIYSKIMLKAERAWPGMDVTDPVHTGLTRACKMHDGRKGFVTFAWSIVRWELSHAYRAEQRRPKMVELFDSGIKMREDIEEYLEYVTRDRDRDVLRLWLLGWFYSEIAEIYGFDMSRAAQLVKRALQEIREGVQSWT